MLERLKTLLPPEKPSTPQNPAQQSQLKGQEILATIRSVEDLPAAKAALDALPYQLVQRSSIDTLALFYEDVKEGRDISRRLYDITNLSSDPTLSAIPIRSLCDQLLNLAHRLGLFRTDHGGDLLVANDLLQRLSNRLLHVRVLNRGDVAPEGCVEIWRLVGVELERHRDVD